MAEAKIHNFDGSLVVEKRVRALLAEVWAEHAFFDVTGDGRFQDLDVDYLYSPAPDLQQTPPDIAALVTAKKVWVELKADSTPHPNMFLELISNAKYGVDTPGCFLFSQAYAWCYVFEDTREMFVFDLGAMRTWVLSNFKELKPFLKATTNQKKDGSYALTVGFAVPMSKLLAETAGVVPMTYMKLPGFGVAAEGERFPKRSRLPIAFKHLDRGLDGLIAFLSAAPCESSLTKVVAYRSETSPLRRHIIPIKELALNQTNKIWESVKKSTLGPHYAPLQHA